MAASPAAAPSPKTDGGNALATLLAAAAATMHQQQHRQQQQLLHQQRQLQQQAHHHVDLKSISPHNKPATLNSSNKKSNYTNNNRGTTTNNQTINNLGNRQAIPNGTWLANNNITTATTAAAATTSTTTNTTNNINSNQTIQKELEAKRDTLCQLLNLKPALELRNLESWHDEDGKTTDESCYQELVDPSNSNGWSADEMFKYNEKMHKIASSYNEKTHANNYTTPLPKLNSKTTVRLASQLAKEIEERVIAEGRITPESSDDDELFEAQRLQRVQLKQKDQLDLLRSLQAQSKHRFNSNGQVTVINGYSSKKTKTPSSQHKNSNGTPATTSLSSSPSLNETSSIIKPVTSSSRNILRTCLI